VVSHDIESSFQIADKMIILFYGNLIAQGTPEEIKNSDDPKVRQFISGSPDGPIPFTLTDKDFIDDILIQ
jgi:phospholipid/cholesterol/gamma-HCH transport system ATP-binding protein